MWDSAERAEPDATGFQTITAYERHDETTFTFGDLVIPPHRAEPSESTKAFDEITPILGLPMTMTVPLRFDNDPRPPGAKDATEPIGVFQFTATLVDAGPTLRQSWFLGHGAARLPAGTLAKTASWSPSIFATGATGQRYGTTSGPIKRITLGGPITGGTGTYAGANGEFRVIGINTNTGKLIYRFTTPGPLWP